MYPTVDTVIKELDKLIREYRCHIQIRRVYKELSIFDWWPDNLNLQHLKQMRGFLEFARKIGFDGYCCFKVGASGCANGMWAYRERSENGYAPDTPNYLYKSFTPDYTRWVLADNGKEIEAHSLNELKQTLQNNVRC